MSLLIMYGVYLEQLRSPDDIIENYIMSEMNTFEPIVIYSELQKEFTSYENWEKSTNLKCWCCDQLFSNVPTAIPMTPRKINGVEVFVMHGNDCSWTCTLRRLRNNFDTETVWLCEKYIDIIRKKWPNYTAVLKESPDKTTLKEYCGVDGLSLAEFREIIQSLNT